jgi:hypothetical protein
LEKCETNLKRIKRNHALGDLEKEIYLEVKSEMEGKINEISKKLHNGDGKLSNLNGYIDTAIKVVSNTSNYWASSDLPTKKRIHETMFPDGITIDVKNRTYLTKKVNLVFDLTRMVSSIVEGEKKNGNRNFLLPSSIVAYGSDLSNFMNGFQSLRDLMNSPRSHFRL